MLSPSREDYICFCQAKRLTAEHLHLLSTWEIQSWPLVLVRVGLLQFTLIPRVKPFMVTMGTIECLPWPFFFFFGGVRVWTRGLTLCRQMLSHSASPTMALLLRLLPLIFASLVLAGHCRKLFSVLLLFLESVIIFKATCPQTPCSPFWASLFWCWPSKFSLFQ